MSSCESMMMGKKSRMLTAFNSPGTRGSSLSAGMKPIAQPGTALIGTATPNHKSEASQSVSVGQWYTVRLPSELSMMICNRQL